MCSTFAVMVCFAKNLLKGNYPSQIHFCSLVWCLPLKMCLNQEYIEHLGMDIFKNVNLLFK